MSKAINIKANFEKALGRLGVTAETPLLAAVSGGPDSSALLSLLVEWSREHGGQVAAAHFNHRLRPESDGEADQVGELCKSLNVSFEIGVGDVAGYARVADLSVHAAARKLRYAFLASVAKDWGKMHSGFPALIVTGHQRDDQMETLLMRLFAGSGVEGLAGMRETAPCPGDADVTVIRPLLEIPRADLETYCRAKKVPYIIDASNSDERYPRSKIRERMLPEIALVLGSEGYAGIFRSLELLAMAASFISSETEKALTYSLVCRNSGEIILDYSRLSSYFSLLRLGIIQRAARLAGGEEVRISFERCLAADKTIERSTRPIQLGEGLSIRRWSGRLYVYADPPDWQPQSFSPARGALIPGVGFLKAEIINAAAATIPPPPGTLWLDFAALTAPLVVRPVRAGDRIKPFGASHYCSVLDLLRNAGAPPHRRYCHPVIESGDDLVAIPPYRIAEACKLTSMSDKALKLTLEAAAQTPLFELQDFYDRPNPLQSRPRKGRRREEISQA